MQTSLSNKSFISTRPSGQNGELKTLLEKEGATLMELPTIEIVPTETNERANFILSRLKTFTWIVFTSANGVFYFFHHLRHVQGNTELPKSTKIAVIGKKTEAVLNEFGYHSNIENPGLTSVELGTVLMSKLKNEDHVLFPEGDLALGTIKRMAKMVAKQTSLTVYENKIPQSFNAQIVQNIIDQNYDQIIITSPSAFHNLITILDNRVKTEELKLISIGRTTTNAIMQHNINAPTASMTNAAGIVHSIIDLYTNNQ